MLAALSSFCLVWKFPGRSRVLTLGNLQEGSYYFSPTHSTHTSPPEKGFDEASSTFGSSSTLTGLYDEV